MISRRRFIYCAATGLMMPFARAGLPFPVSFFGGGKCGTISPAATLALNDWVTRVQGQSSDVTIQGTQEAVGCYIYGLMADGVWTKLVRHSIFAGDGLNALKAPLRDGGQYSVNDTLNNFVSGDYSQSTGLAGDGSTKYMAVGIGGNSVLLGDNDIHCALYVRTAANFLVMGASDGVTLQNSMQMDFGSGNAVWDSNNFGTGRTLVAGGTTVAGLYVGSRTSSSLSVLYRNATNIGQVTAAGGTRDGHEISVFTVNSNNTQQFFSNNTCEMYSIGTGLTATDVANFTARYATLRARLGR